MKRLAKDTATPFGQSKPPIYLGRARPESLPLQAPHRAGDRLFSGHRVNLLERYDYPDSASGQQLALWMRRGFQGFDNMALPDLLQAASDSGVADRLPQLFGLLLASLPAAGPEGAGDVEAGLVGATGAPVLSPRSPAVFKSVLQLTVLHDLDVDLAAMPLGDLVYECAHGGFLGGHKQVVSKTVLTQAQLDEEAQALGADGAHFGEPDGAVDAQGAPARPRSARA